MSKQTIIPWRWVTPLDGSLDGSLAPQLARVDALRVAWEEFIGHVSPEEFAEARRRSLRRHAIETGIIERLYDVSWGVTEAFVAEGLTREVAEREEGGLDEDALTTIRTQFEALEFLADAVREGQDLTINFIKQLHVAITRNQATYEARDAYGQLVQPLLRHGQWKQHDNHVHLEDGALLEYTPHEHVAAEMERLVELYRGTEDEHPLVRAAWIHHRFIGVHPFEDGNGRVARALVLLVLLRAGYAPLVVDRTRRAEYLDALGAANEGHLQPLVSLFADLERIAMRSELQRSAAVGASPVDVARGYAERLRDIKLGTDRARAAAVSSLARDVQDRLDEQLDRLGNDLRSAFSEIDPAAYAKVIKASPPEPEVEDEDRDDRREVEEREDPSKQAEVRLADGAQEPLDPARYWYAQLVEAAKATNFFANLSDGSWWVRLRLVVLKQELRFVVATQKVGQGETGVLAVTVFAELVPPHGTEEDSRPLPVPLFVPTSADSVTLDQTDSVDDRWTEICDLVERSLAAAVAQFGQQLG